MYLVTHILRSKKGNCLRYVYMSNLLLRCPLYVFGHAYIILFKICVHVQFIVKVPSICIWSRIIEIEERNCLRYVYMSNLLLRCPLYVFGHAYIEIEERELFKICVYVQFIVKVPSICIWSRIY